MTLCSVYAQDDSFITKLEYGEMLYNNPRGISCIKCHGTKGESKFFVNYKTLDKRINAKVTKNITIPDIRKVDLAKYKEALQGKEDTNQIMPTYFLSDEEVMAIFYYLKKTNNMEAKLK